MRKGRRGRQILSWTPGRGLGGVPDAVESQLELRQRFFVVAGLNRERRNPLALLFFSPVATE